MAPGGVIREKWEKDATFISACRERGWPQWRPTQHSKAGLPEGRGSNQRRMGTELAKALAVPAL